MGDLSLDAETKEILDSLPPRSKSKFVREAVKAKKYGEYQNDTTTEEKEVIHDVRFDIA